MALRFLLDEDGRELFRNVLEFLLLDSVRLVATETGHDKVRDVAAELVVGWPACRVLVMLARGGGGPSARLIHKLDTTLL